MNSRELVPAWAEAMAEEFWTSVGGWPGAPVAIEGSLGNVLDIAVMPRLSVARVATWLAQRGVHYQFPCADRALHGCLLVHAGNGVVFVDGSDPPNEQRLTLAHEGAHFLRHYLSPRVRAISTFGQVIVEALDGRREPTADERIHGALLDIQVGPHVHLVERDSAGRFERGDVWGAEIEADVLAVELLAPAAAVRRELEAAGVLSSYLACRRVAEVLLIDRYDLPVAVARQYARHLAEALTGGPGVLEEWGLL